jgi:hypothetical protein
LAGLSLPRAWAWRLRHWKRRVSLVGGNREMQMDSRLCLCGLLFGDSLYWLDILGTRDIINSAKIC